MTDYINSTEVKTDMTTKEIKAKWKTVKGIIPTDDYDSQYFKDMKVSQKSNKIAIIRMLRTSKGLRLYCKSEPIAKLMSSYSACADTESNSISTEWNFIRMKAWNSNIICNDSIFDEGQLDDETRSQTKFRVSIKNGLRSWNSQYTVLNANYLEETGEPNISWLMACDLGKGITVSFTEPVSNRQFKLFSKLVHQAIAWIWENFCRINIICHLYVHRKTKFQLI